MLKAETDKIVFSQMEFAISTSAYKNLKMGLNLM